MDQNQDDMVSYAEFCRGMGELVQVALPVLEQIYSLMDKDQVGLITYQQFLNVIKHTDLEKPTRKDNFDWEVQAI